MPQPERPAHRRCPRKAATFRPQRRRLPPARRSRRRSSTAAAAGSTTRCPPPVATAQIINPMTSTSLSITKPRRGAGSSRRLKRRIMVEDVPSGAASAKSLTRRVLTALFRSLVRRAFCPGKILSRNDFVPERFAGGGSVSGSAFISGRGALGVEPRKRASGCCSSSGIGCTLPGAVPPGAVPPGSTPFVG